MKRVLTFGFAALLSVVPSFAQNSNANARALAAAMDHFQANARAYGLTNAADELKVRGSRDANGFTHIRYDQYYRGIKVFEGEAISHVKNGKVEVTNAIRGNINVNTVPSIAAATAVQRVMSELAPKGPYGPPSANLEIVARGEDSATDRLVWHVSSLIDNEIDAPSEWQYFIDAHSGQLVFKYNNLHTTSSTTTGNSMYLGAVTLDTDTVGGTISIKDNVRSGNTANNMFNGTTGNGTLMSTTGTSFGNGTRAKPGQAGYDANTAAVDAHYGLMRTWDYYKQKHNRNGIDNAGKATFSRLHYSSNYDNAFWQDACFCMTYGDGSSFSPLVSIDVAGHEMSHGVMSREANLTYRGESGGLNEANSDMMGTMVEFFANAPGDTPDYLIGEKLYAVNYNADGTFKSNPTKALRYMTKPSLDGASPNCYTKQLKSLDVHYSSGPANHMFYLLSNGGTSACTGTTLAGIGNDAAATIWYTAVRDYMTASTNYAGARAAALQAAAAIYGSGSAQYNAVAAAFSAIKVN
jgi:Zn-dependent metalloprotease